MTRLCLALDVPTLDRAVSLVSKTHQVFDTCAHLFCYKFNAFLITCLDRGFELGNIENHNFTAWPEAPLNAFRLADTTRVRLSSGEGSFERLVDNGCITLQRLQGVIPEHLLIRALTDANTTKNIIIHCQRFLIRKRLYYLLEDRVAARIKIFFQQCLHNQNTDIIKASQNDPSMTRTN